MNKLKKPKNKTNSKSQNSKIASQFPKLFRDSHDKKQTRKICPKCKSSYISLWMGAELGIVYQCQECGYRGPVVIEEDVSDKK